MTRASGSTRSLPALMMRSGARSMAWLIRETSCKVSVPVHGVAPAVRLAAKVTLVPLLTDAAGSVSSLPAVETSDQ